MESKNDKSWQGLKRIALPLILGILGSGTAQALDPNKEIGARFEGPVSYSGQWLPNPSFFNDEWTEKEITIEQFGSFVLQNSDGSFMKSLATGEIKTIRHLHYPVGTKADGELLYGMKIIPTTERFVDVPFVYPQIAYSTDDSTKVIGSTLLDQELAEYYFGENVNYFAETGLQDFHRENEFITTRLQALEYSDLENEINDSQPVVGIVGVTHPEYWYGQIAELGGEDRYETQGGISHMGLYIGLGRQLDAPMGYSSGGVMASESTVSHIYGVKLKKPAPNANEFEDMRLVNRNLYISYIVVNAANGGVVFADNYTQDKLKMVDLKDTLAVYRGMLDREWVYEKALTEEEMGRWNEIREAAGQRNTAIDYNSEEVQSLTFFWKLRNDPVWYSYCAEYAYNATNIGLNLIHNQKRYKEAYGEEVGAKLWTLAQTAYQDITSGFTNNDEGYFFKELPYNAFTPLFESGIAGQESGIVFNRFGAEEDFEAMAWPAQTTFDILSAFVQNYNNWLDIGAYSTVASIMSLAPQVKSRMNIDLDTYYSYVAPIIASILTRDLALSASRDPSVTAFASFRNWHHHINLIREPIADQVKAALNAQLYLDEDSEMRASVYGSVDRAMERVYELATYQGEETNLRTNYYRRGLIQATQYADASLERKIEAAYTGYVWDIRRHKKNAREVMINELGYDGDEWSQLVQNYSPPAILHRIIQNQHKKHDRIEIKVVGTVMNTSQVTRKTRHEHDFDNTDGESITQFDTREGL